MAMRMLLSRTSTNAVWHGIASFGVDSLPASSNLYMGVMSDTPTAPANKFDPAEMITKPIEEQRALFLEACKLAGVEIDPETLVKGNNHKA